MGGRICRRYNVLLRRSPKSWESGGLGCGWNLRLGNNICQRKKKQLLVLTVESKKIEREPGKRTEIQEPPGKMKLSENLRVESKNGKGRCQITGKRRKNEKLQEKVSEHV